MLIAAGQGVMVVSDFVHWPVQPRSSLQSLDYLLCTECYTQTFLVLWITIKMIYLSIV